MNYTTIEQSKKLIELGLNPETADMINMCYSYSFDGKNYSNCKYKLRLLDEREEPFMPELNIPSWSLGVLLDLLPPSIQTGEGMQNQYEIDIRKYWGDEENLYQIAYGNNRGLSEEWHDMINTGEKKNLIDAAFQMVCWLLENEYIKKGK